MSNGSRRWWIGAALVLVALAPTAVFTIEATETGIVTRFGRPLEGVRDPGLHFKMPWPVDQVERIDSRLLLFDNEPSEMLTLEAGYGHEEVEIDDTDNTQEANQYYVNCTVNIAPGFFIVPEVGMLTFEEDASNGEPEVFYWGAKWQINF